MRNRYQGFSLIELLVVLMIIGVIASIGVPSFNATIQRTKLTTMINEFVTDLIVARSEAIKRNQRVVMEKINANWEDGWQIFVDADSNNTFNDNGNAILCEDGEDCLLQEHEPLPNSYTLRANNNFTNFIAYTPLGLSNNMGSFVLCYNSDDNTEPRPDAVKLVAVNRLGRARVSIIDADGDGIPERDDGSEVATCL
jgi:type IV fimbrial biogenesis protein FimT